MGQLGSFSRRVARLKSRVPHLDPSDGRFGRYEAIEPHMDGADRIYSAAGEMPGDGCALLLTPKDLSLAGLFFCLSIPQRSGGICCRFCSCYQWTTWYDDLFHKTHLVHCCLWEAVKPDHPPLNTTSFVLVVILRRSSVIKYHPRRCLRF
jgi:hypothetical protein